MHFCVVMEMVIIMTYVKMQKRFSCSPMGGGVGSLGPPLYMHLSQWCSTTRAPLQCCHTKHNCARCGVANRLNEHKPGERQALEDRGGVGRGEQEEMLPFCSGSFKYHFTLFLMEVLTNNWPDRTELRHNSKITCKG